MKFTDYRYERPDFEALSQEIKNLIETIQNSESLEQQLEKITDINKIQDHISTMQSLSYIRHSQDIRDGFYDGENDYWDEFDPLYTELFHDFAKAVAGSKFRDGLAGIFGKQYFALLDGQVLGFSPEIVEDLQEDNRLSSEYAKLLASAKFEFNGEALTLSGLGKYMEDKDREVRQAATELRWSFFQEHEETLDRIFDQLVKVRDKMAKKLGFDNYVQLGYINMNRTDYGPEEVANFRKQVLEEIVPVCNELYEWQRERLGYDKLRYFDLDVEYLDGNASPKGSPEWILENGLKMYEEMSPETKEFFEFMVERDLLDLVNRPGKEGGGYCSYIEDYQSPFIFSNFNGTSGDIDVLTHEAGHAFQGYLSRHIEIPELRETTYDSAEIHSMSMEFFAWPWMENFFKEDTDKYKFSHLSGSLKFIPYGVMVDEFQHLVYENPQLTPQERKAKWRELEGKYVPHKNYEGNDLLERGGFWFTQSHIFEDPFYYIDYTLAGICALQFWKRMREDREEAWNDYVNLCKIGGIRSFLGLVSYGNLESPFEDGCVKSVISEISEWLRGHKIPTAL